MTGEPEVQVDDAEVRVTRWSLGEGESTGHHRHEYDYVVVPVAPGTMQVTHPDGSVTEKEMAVGVAYRRYAGVEHSVAPAHGEIDFVEVEVKGTRPLREETEETRYGRSLVRPVREADFARWRELYRGYADFYGVDQPDENAATVWAWLHDPRHELEGLVAVDAGGSVTGLAHYRPFARPLTATVGGWVDDLFVDPAARGTGAVDALAAHVQRIAKARGWSVVRGITREDNHRAQAVYRRFGERTTWAVYDMEP